MDISDFTIRLIFLLIPGTISCLIIETIALHKKWTQFRFIINAVLLGLFSFLLLQWVYFHGKFSGTEQQTLKTWDSIFNKEELNYTELFQSVIVSVFLGYFVGAAIQYKLINRLAQKIRFSVKYGDDSLFMHYLATQTWIYIRDKKNGLTYCGQVDSYAEDEKSKDIVLRQATVYDYKTSAVLYSMPRIYLKFHDCDIIIETAKEELSKTVFDKIKDFFRRLWNIVTSKKQ